MTDGYRQKLLDWLTSMLLLILLTVLSLASYWFLDEPDVIVRPYGWDGVWKPELVDYAGPMGDTLSIFHSGFYPLAIWHLFDLLQRADPQAKWARILASSASLHTVLAVLCVLLPLLTSGYFTYVEPCGGGFVFLSQDCSYIKGVLSIPLIILLLFLLILCMGKAAISIRSLIKKAP